jgi:hypothetical protein
VATFPPHALLEGTALELAAGGSLEVARRFFGVFSLAKLAFWSSHLALPLGSMLVLQRRCVNSWPIPGGGRLLVASTASTAQLLVRLARVSSGPTTLLVQLMIFFIVVCNGHAYCSALPLMPRQ